MVRKLSVQFAAMANHCRFQKVEVHFAAMPNHWSAKIGQVNLSYGSPLATGCLLAASQCLFGQWEWLGHLVPLFLVHCSTQQNDMKTQGKIVVRCQSIHENGGTHCPTAHVEVWHSVPLSWICLHARQFLTHFPYQAMPMGSGPKTFNCEPVHCGAWKQGTWQEGEDTWQSRQDSRASHNGHRWSLSCTRLWPAGWACLTWQAKASVETRKTEIMQPQPKWSKKTCSF